MESVWVILIVTVCAPLLALAQTNLLVNGDFESSDYNGNWYCKGGCTLTPDNDAYSGVGSVRVSNRYT